MRRYPFWRYYWLNTRWFLFGGLVIGVIWSSFWSYQDGRLNLWPFSLGGFLLVASIVGTVFEYKRYNRKE